MNPRWWPTVNPTLQGQRVAVQSVTKCQRWEPHNRMTQVVWILSHSLVGFISCHSSRNCTLLGKKVHLINTVFKDATFATAVMLPC